MKDLQKKKLKKSKVFDIYDPKMILEHLSGIREIYFYNIEYSIHFKYEINYIMNYILDLKFQ